MSATVAGVAVPDSAICVAATDLARQLSEPFLFNHVMRTYAFGALAGTAAGASCDLELLYLGCALHDLGLSADADLGDRFEVEGADMASEFLVERGLSEDRVAVVWDAIALHTTVAVPQRKQPEIALVQTGAAIDVGVVPHAGLPSAAVAEVLARWPASARAGAVRACRPVSGCRSGPPVCRAGSGRPRRRPGSARTLRPRVRPGR